MGSLQDYSGHTATDEKDTIKTIDIALYNLQRAHATLASLEQKSELSNSDTAFFDCMHYDGDAALEHLAKKLDLKSGQNILDVGSGFSATGRVLCSRYGVHVTGVELQREVHEVAEVIIGKNENVKVRNGVSSVCADFLTVKEELLGHKCFDYVISLLCIVHLPQESRRTVFQQAARFLKPGGKVYIEDFYQRGKLTDVEAFKFQKFVGGSYMPTKDTYIADVEAAGFTDLESEDLTKHWTDFVAARAQQYKNRPECDVDLEIFYDTIDECFKGGNFGGLRLIATKR